MGKQIALVLRSGGEFLPKHVELLVDQLHRFAPCSEVFCLSDIDVRGVQIIPLQHGYPGWWSKMELMRPDIEGDFLYLDLDTRIIGDISEICATSTLSMLFRHYATDGSKRYGSGVMYLTEEARREAWGEWQKEGPDSVMRRCKGGDQKILEWWWRGKVTALQDLHPGQLRSFKLECQDGVPPNTRVVYFHGKPRPWEPAGSLRTELQNGR